MYDILTTTELVELDGKLNRAMKCWQLVAAYIPGHHAAACEAAHDMAMEMADAIAYAWSSTP